MPYPLTKSRLTDGGKNRTGTSLSTNIIIKVGSETIGAIQSLQITESRNIRMIEELGTDGHIDSAPNKSVDISGSCTRIRFDRLRIFEAFSRGYSHLHAQRYPFDIEIIDIQNAASDSANPLESENTIITVVKNVWFNNIQYQYQAGEFVISETAQFQAETIQSFLVGGTKNINTGGTRNLQAFKDAIELEADRGGRRGAMDAPGLINAFVNVDAF